VEGKVDDACENILKGVRKVEGVNIAKTVLDMCINDKLRQAKDFLTQVERIPKTTLLFRGQRPIKPIVNTGQFQRIERWKLRTLQVSNSYCSRGASSSGSDISSPKSARF
jgi:hypothetical protein